MNVDINYQTVARILSQKLAAALESAATWEVIANELAVKLSALETDGDSTDQEPAV